MSEMKLYDAVCPICGRLNKNLYLDDSNGNMECEACHTVVELFPMDIIGKIVSITSKGNDATIKLKKDGYRVYETRVVER